LGNAFTIFARHERVHVRKFCAFLKNGSLVGLSIKLMHTSLALISEFKSIKDYSSSIAGYISKPSKQGAQKTSMHFC
jgi:hypothetical protein